MSESVLVVDDEPAVRTMLCRVLMQHGYAVTEAASAEQALSLLETSPADLVITDLNMPGSSGLGLAQNLLSQDPSRPVMVITGYADVDSARRALRLGVYEYFTKPLDVNEVVSRVQRALERRRLVLENLTFQRALERRVSEGIAEVEQSHWKLAEADRLASAGRLSPPVVHEMLNCLSIVSGRVEMVLMTKNLEDEDRGNLETALSQVRKAVIMLNDLRKGSRKRTGGGTSPDRGSRPCS